MKVFTLLPLTFLAALASAQTVSVTYDQTYDDASVSLNEVACSNGVNGLESKGFTTLGSLPTFPFIGGAPAVTGWNSTGCGTCWSLAFNGTTIKVLAVDFSTGFNIGLTAMNNLTNGQAVQRGKVSAVATQLKASACGL